MVRYKMDLRPSLLNFFMNWCLVCWLLPAMLSSVGAELCDVTTGLSAIILNLPESSGQQTDQRTSPGELPLEGATEVSLTISEEGARYFNLTGATLRLLQPLDRDELALNTIRFTVVCRAAVAGSNIQRSVPVVVRIVDINDNAPRFVGAPYKLTLPESTPVGTTVFSDILATDADTGANGQIRYSIVPGTGDARDGYGFLSIPLPHQRHVTVTKPLDYERSPVLVVNVQAADASATNQQSSITTLTIILQDSDDQDPQFQCSSPDSEQQECVYSASVVAGHRSGVMDVQPARIFANDMDALGATVRYSLEAGEPASFRQFFSIDRRSGALNQVAPVPRGLTNVFELSVKAEEQTPRKGSVSSSLRITVVNPDSSMPVLRASVAAGVVEENSLPGTPVLDPATDQPIRLTVTDPDLLPGETPPTYQFELTSGAFLVSPTGELQVAVGGLDRDPPSPHTHTFQVVAREVLSAAASAPITLAVRLLDTNDNSPRFSVHPPLVVPAGGGPRTLTRVVAHDPDEGPHGTLQYGLTDVTGGSGEARFTVDADTGDVFLLGGVNKGQNYRLQIEAIDGGGKRGAMFLDVLVDRGANTGGPYFPRRQFSTIVPEDTLPGSTVIRLKAVDPDGDVPRYSLHVMVQKENGLPAEEEELPFQVDPLSGEVTLSAPLDRETKHKYSMIITAEDDERLRGSVSLDVLVADVNDVVPMFQDLPYSFRVEEGQDSVMLGVVKAVDMDEDRSGLVQYSVPEDAPLSVGPYNGTLYTTRALDYEKQRVHYVVVTATDGGRPPLSATTTLTLLVGDVSDEPPVFLQPLVRVNVSEDVEIGSLIATLEATDPDSTPTVTYIMRSGAPENRVFAVHPDTGRVTVTAPLDRETTEQYIIEVGTQENGGNGPGAMCQLVVTLEDVNDSPPSLLPLSPLLIPLDTAPGALLTQATAADGDATSPNNKVHFSLTSGVEDLSAYLTIDAANGDIRLNKKFAGSNITELQMEVVARDGGRPPLSSSTPLLVLVEVEGAPPPRIIVPPTFARSQVFVSIKESTPVGGTVARVGVINPPLDPICVLKEDSEYFRAVLTDSGDCGVELSGALDAESSHGAVTVLTLTLMTADPASAVPNITAKINITVEDVNDNVPVFTLSPMGAAAGGGALLRLGERAMALSQDTLIVTTSDYTEVGAILYTLQATDADSGSNGRLRYSLLPSSNRGGYFALDAASGSLLLSRPLQDVPQGLNPFNLTVEAADEPSLGKSLQDSITVMVNVITPAHRLVVPVPAPSSIVMDRRQHLVQAMAGRDDTAVVLERIVSVAPAAERTRQATSSPAGPTTEVWLALLDPRTGLLLPKTHPRVNRIMSRPSDEPGSLRYQLLHAVGEAALRKPAVHETVTSQAVRPSIFSVQDSVFGGTALSDGGPESMIASVPGLQLGLVVLAIVILILGLVSILYICVHWARAVRDREKGGTLPILRVPIMPHHHAPSSSITDTLHKQYEVQVLHMSVPFDNESTKDVTPPRSAHNFFMDNVSYISKNNPLVNDSRSDHGMDEEDQSTPSPPTWVDLPSTSGGLRSQQVAYIPHHDSDSDDLGSIPDNTDHQFSHSATNHNVMFGRRDQLEAAASSASPNGRQQSPQRENNNTLGRNSYAGGHQQQHQYHQRPNSNLNTGNMNGTLPRNQSHQNHQQLSTGFDSPHQQQQHHQLQQHHQNQQRSPTHAQHYNSRHNNSSSTSSSNNSSASTNRPHHHTNSRGSSHPHHHSNNPFGTGNRRRHSQPRVHEAQDDGVIGYGFQGAGIGGPLSPIMDLSSQHTATLL